MKKLVAMSMIACMAMATVACGSSNSGDTAAAETTESTETADAAEDAEAAEAADTADTSDKRRQNGFIRDGDRIRRLVYQALGCCQISKNRICYISERKKKQRSENLRFDHRKHEIHTLVFPKPIPHCPLAHRRLRHAERGSFSRQNRCRTLMTVIKSGESVV